jgi:hypothetical protein
MIGDNDLIGTGESAVTLVKLTRIDLNSLPVSTNPASQPAAG